MLGTLEDPLSLPVARARIASLLSLVFSTWIAASDSSTCSTHRTTNGALREANLCNILGGIRRVVVSSRPGHLSGSSCSSSCPRLTRFHLLGPPYGDWQVVWAVFVVFYVPMMHRCLISLACRSGTDNDGWKYRGLPAFSSATTCLPKPTFDHSQQC